MRPDIRLVPPCVALIGVSYGLARFAYGLFLPSIREAVSLTPTAAGWIGSGAYVGYCVAIVFSALLVERVGPRLMTISAGVTATLGMALIAVSYSPAMLACAVLLAGTSTGLASPPMAQAVSQVIAQPRQATANTFINSGTSVGVMLSGPIALVALEQWRMAYFAFATLAALTTVWVALCVPGPSNKRMSDAAVTTSSSPPISGKGVIRADAIPLLLATIGMGFVSAPYWTFAGEVMVNVGNLSSRLVSISWVIIGIAGLAGGFAGTLIRRFGLNLVHRTFIATLSVAMLTLAVLSSQTVLVLLSAAAFGAAYIMLTGVYLVWGIRVYDDRPAVGLGLAFLMIAIGQAVGTPVVGMFIESVGYPIAFVIFSGLTLGILLTGHHNSEYSSHPPSSESATGQRCHPESYNRINASDYSLNYYNHSRRNNNGTLLANLNMPAMPPLAMLRKIKRSIGAWRDRQQS